ncbi:MAG: FHA domain-containing protein [Candidatus Nanopelagicales bacterium]
MLTPWSEIIELSEGCSVPLGRDHGFSDYADRLTSSLYVSRAHVFLFVRDGLLFARDHGSHNGTARNGDLLTAHEDVALEVGDALTLGGQETFFVVR